VVEVKRNIGFEMNRIGDIRARAKVDCAPAGGRGSVDGGIDRLRVEGFPVAKRPKVADIVNGFRGGLSGACRAHETHNSQAQEASHAAIDLFQR
jgi:hypothetical protein